MDNTNSLKTVYLVEDDSFLGRILSNNLDAHGLKVRLIPSGKDALEAIREEVPDLLLLDLFIPELSGLDVLEAIRKDEKTKDLKVIVVSNTDDADSRKKVEELGAGFVIKAVVTPDEIVQKAMKALQ